MQFIVLPRGTSPYHTRYRINYIRSGPDHAGPLLSNTLNMRLSALFILTIPLFLRCSNGDETNHSQKEQQDTPTTYSLAGKPTLKWTAYKFTSRVGVSGTLDEIEYVTKRSSGSLSDLLKGASFTINPASVNSNLKLRDDRIWTSLFQKMAVDEVSGQFIDLNDKDGMLELTIGSTTREIPYVIQSDVNTISIETEIDLLDWQGKPGLDALNSVCEDLHRGPDGISKLWPDVSIKVSIPINPGNIALCD